MKKIALIALVASSFAFSGEVDDMDGRALPVFSITLPKTEMGASRDSVKVSKVTFNDTKVKTSGIKEAKKPTYTLNDKVNGQTLHYGLE